MELSWKTVAALAAIVIVLAVSAVSVSRLQDDIDKLTAQIDALQIGLVHRIRLLQDLSSLLKEEGITVTEKADGGLVVETPHGITEITPYYGH